MENAYFKMIGQKSSNGKMILVAVVDEDFFGHEVPNIFAVQCFKPAANIYTGTYPTIKINTDTLIKRNDLNASGIAGIITGEEWYYQREKDKDILGINLKS